LRPENRRAVLHALPFILRVLAQRRQDHGAIERGLTSTLLSDRGADALALGKELDTSGRRKMYELLTGHGAERHVLSAALEDSDAVIRARAMRAVACNPASHDRAAILERLVRDDRVPAVRRLALSLLREHVPARVGAVFPRRLLGPSGQRARPCPVRGA
jgi:hypothetical protein